MSNEQKSINENRSRAKSEEKDSKYKNKKIEEINKSEYKEINLGPKKLKVPKNWEKYKINDIACLKNGYAFKSDDYVDEGIPLLRAINISDNAEINFHKDTKYLPLECYEDYKQLRLKEDDIVLVMVGASSGKLGQVQKEVLPTLLNQNMWRIRPSDDRTNKTFLFYVLKKSIDRFLSQKVGSARSYLKKGDFKKFKIVLPPIQEQKNIAEILSTVDEAIQKTEEIIETTKELKKGLMQDLLTKGIDHNEFKEVQLGPKKVSIPRKWSFKYFNEVVELNPSYDIPDKEEFDFLPMDAINEETKNIEYWNKRKLDDCTRVRFKNCDTVYGKITPCTENGKISFVKGVDTGIAFGSTEFLVFHPKEGLSPKYLYYLSNLPIFRQVTISMMEGSTGRQRVPLDIFKRNLKIPIPGKREQEEITNVLTTIDKKIRREKEKKEKLEDLKEGLMQDLLTGKVRTEDLDLEDFEV